MVDYTRGGKGKLAPYETTHLRIPKPVKHLCEQISAVYKQRISSPLDPKAKQFIRELQDAIAKASYPNFDPVNHLRDTIVSLKTEVKELWVLIQHERLRRYEDKKQYEQMLEEAYSQSKNDRVKSKEQAVEIAKKALRSKKSLKVSLAKVLSEIYQQEVTLDD